MRNSPAAGTPRSRRAAILAANPRGAIYGTIVATAVIAATAGHTPPWRILAATVATLLVFWLAHVYADFLDHGLRQARFGLGILAALMVRELSMLAAPALSILFLLLGALGLLDEELAIRLALWNGVVQLVAWGVDVGRRRGLAWPAALLTGLVNGAFGVVIILLEVLLH
jgi:energy-coupling factor transporter transmembrane protein EcfT